MQLAADNLHALNPVVSGALKDLDPVPLQELARQCELPGVHFIDINPGYLSKRYEDRMELMVEAVQESTPLRLILDSPNPRVLWRGLMVCREKPVLSALSLEPHKIEEILPLAVEHQTKLVLLLMDEHSRVPNSMEERLAVAVELRERALNAGLRDEDLIFDPVLPNLSWPDAAMHVREVVRTIRMLSGWSLFPEPVQTMIGLSNLRSGLRSRYPLELETACLAMLAGAGLSLALANVLQNGFMPAFQRIQPFTF
jgi:5-methyltetrahydrofolate corrinoid/iron sulfur protein methyltransferase